MARKEEWAGKRAAGQVGKGEGRPMAGLAGTGETVARACVVCVQCEKTCVRYGTAQLQLGSGHTCVLETKWRSSVLLVNVFVEGVVICS
jgi:hypothetical protein